ncbi:hypothetical protein EW146_g6126 [Bondarzewia mesenterica]|uniref:Uncharacterized protein n=1 Tax=Bondarzewia mesenterica TaxID=1095465 RepID=A0A4S4LRD2_9AGAM|nr:hypothetical protein EW146_g6126 [Bondarzewia mesenterica]
MILAFSGFTLTSRTASHGIANHDLVKVPLVHAFVRALPSLAFPRFDTMQPYSYALPPNQLWCGIQPNEFESELSQLAKQLHVYTTTTTHEVGELVSGSIPSYDQHSCEIYGRIHSLEGGGLHSEPGSTAGFYYGNVPYSVACATENGSQSVMLQWQAATSGFVSQPQVGSSEACNIIAPVPRLPPQTFAQFVNAHTRSQESAIAPPAEPNFFGQHADAKERSNRHSPISLYGKSPHREIQQYYGYPPSLIEGETFEPCHDAMEYSREGRLQEALFTPQSNGADTSSAGSFISQPTPNHLLLERHRPRPSTVTDTEARSSSSPRSLTESPMGHLPYPEQLAGIERAQHLGHLRHVPQHSCATAHSHSIDEELTAAPADTWIDPRGDAISFPARSTDNLETFGQSVILAGGVVQRLRKRVVRSVQPLACFFCRGRKIACGPADPNSPDKTCR